MLDQRITNFASNSVAGRSIELDEALHVRLGEIRDGAIKTGAYAGSRMFLAYGSEICAELRRRAQLIFSELQRAIALYHPSSLDTLHQDLAEAFSVLLKHQASQLDVYIRAHMGTPANRGDAGFLAMMERFDAELTRLVSHFENVELLGYVEAARQRAQQVASSPGAGVTIYGTVGAVLTGSQATAMVSISVGNEDREALMRALELCTRLINESQQLAAEHRRQMLEVIEQSRTVARADKPNSSMLRGMFSVLTDTLQTLAASGPAMDALRAAALPFGVAI